MRQTVLYLTLLFAGLCGLVGCSNFLEPVKSTGTPTEYEFNYWLLQRTYLFEDELVNLPEEGNSVESLYVALEDPYTRYVPPSKSQSATISINTSYVEGDVGLEYMFSNQTEYPIFVYRVYPKGPAGRAGIPRYGNIREINGVRLNGENAYNTYKAILDTNSEINLVIAKDSKEVTYKIKKENIYAPTVFIDTLYQTIFITITEFKLNTADEENGSYGELKAYLDSTQNEKSMRVINIQGNPGGHVSQCVDMADLFVSEGALSTQQWRIFTPDGQNDYREKTTYASKGDPGEKGKFVILANGRSASCAEIFAAAVSELTDIPIVGSTTFGKGIGQTNWNTIDNGLAIITNLEFKTPKGNSYHKKGLEPDYPCGDTDALKCAAATVESLTGKNKLSKNALDTTDKFPFTIIERDRGIGGAITF